MPFGDLAELCGECEVLVGREVLLGKEDHLVLEERLTDSAPPSPVATARAG